MMKEAGKRTMDMMSARMSIEKARIILRFRSSIAPISRSIIIGIRRGTEKAVRAVKAGDIAYWPMQDALCIFHSDARPYSPVNTVGKVTENLEIFGGLKSGTKMRIERA